MTSKLAMIFLNNVDKTRMNYMNKELRSVFVHCSTTQYECNTHSCIHMASFLSRETIAVIRSLLLLFPYIKIMFTWSHVKLSKN